MCSWLSVHETGQPAAPGSTSPPTEKEKSFKLWMVSLLGPKP